MEVEDFHAIISKYFSIYLLRTRACNHSIIIKFEKLNTNTVMSSNTNYVHISPVVPKMFVIVGYLGDD